MILSRNADACFWIGRYVERAEATARMVDIHYHAGLEAALHTPMGWEALLSITGGREAYAACHSGWDDRTVLHWLAFAPQNPDAIRTSWNAARDNARAIRSQLASEMWESLNAASLELRRWDVDRLMEGGPHLFFQWVKDQSHLFQGIFNRTQIFGEARDWIDMGRFLERADQTTRLLDVKYHNLLPLKADGEPDFGGTLDIHGWISVLRSVSAFEMYRKTHREGITPEGIVAFLVLERRFPASVRHGVERVRGCLERIRAGGPQTEADQLAAALLELLDTTTAPELLAEGLHEVLDTFQLRLARISEAATRTYLHFA